MKRLAQVVTFYKRGQYSDSSMDHLRYWLDRSADERVQACLDLRSDTYRLLNGKDIPRMLRVFRIMKGPRL